MSQNSDKSTDTASSTPKAENNDSISEIVPQTSPASSSGKRSPVQKKPKVASLSQKICICKHCGEKFIGHVNLGGHVSKKHPGLSERYLQKMVTRNAN